MSFLFADTGHWVLLALLIANASVFAASVPKPRSTKTNELAEAFNEPIRINNINPSPDIERQFAMTRQLSAPKPSTNPSLTDHFSYYDIHVPNSDVVLGIRIDDDIHLNFRSIQRLLIIAAHHYTEEVARLGRDTILDGICYMSRWPHLPGTCTGIQVQDDSQDLLTYGMVSDALKGISEFYQANPERDGELVALIKIPRSVQSRPAELVNVGFVTLYKSFQPPAVGSGYVQTTQCKRPRQNEGTPLVTTA